MKRYFLGYKIAISRLNICQRYRKMSNYTLTKHFANISRGILRRSLNRSAHQGADNSLDSDERIDDDLPIELNNPYGKEPVKCILCTHNIEPDYKNARLLSQFQSRYTGRIYGRHVTGLCKSKQNKVESEILKSQNAGFMGYYVKDVVYAKDPPLFDPDHPFRPHKY